MWLIACRDLGRRLGALHALVESAARSLCPLRATDHPTVTVTVFRADSVSRVVDYHGCYARSDLSIAAPVGELRHFEWEIDSVAQSQRWIRPAMRQ